MNDVGVIDRFLAVFSRYIDSGFGLLGPEIAFLSATLVVIDMTLAGLLWATAGDDVIGKLLRKTLYVGAFAFIIGHFNWLAEIIFNSFTGLGLLASGSSLPPEQFLQPGRLAAIGVEAGRPLLDHIASLTGITKTVSNLDSIVVLFLAWLVILISFFILSIQLFVTLIEFKLTTLAGFVLVPFALWNKTAFLAEKVLGNVVSSGIKILVLAVIVGIGSGLFDEFLAAPEDPSIDHALATMLAALALLGLGIFGPGIASGLVSGAPQLGAGAAAGTALGAAGVATGAVAMTTGLGGAAMSGARMAPRIARAAQGGLSGLVRTGSSAAAATDLPLGPSASPQPAWAKQLQRRQRVAQAASTLAHTLRGGDGSGSATGPRLQDSSDT
ncbi:P-type conjugative transfer protein TrbL [Stutzerimonas stutzeri NF13]|uniref:P-type conjugative transfer protein TrbL n=1 Tax=Stutzerimonas stutzeri NF13 TaxID=1212548 RepID=M2VQM3_STUST|nr:P-type conjugative transfer protein TrbL [Stutzerimonas stutzeri]EME01904.1 P-type conjugative transfer protein TrbL [Stutzerimonas stutzeri NF13]